MVTLKTLILSSTALLALLRNLILVMKLVSRTITMVTKGRPFQSFGNPGVEYSSIFALVFVKCYEARKFYAFNNTLTE